VKNLPEQRGFYNCPQCSRRLRFNSIAQLLRVLPTNYALLELMANSVFKAKSGDLSGSAIGINIDKSNEQYFNMRIHNEKGMKKVRCHL